MAWLPVTLSQPADSASQRVQPGWSRRRIITGYRHKPSQHTRLMDSLVVATTTNSACRQSAVFETAPSGSRCTRNYGRQMSTTENWQVPQSSSTKPACLNETVDTAVSGRRCAEDLWQAYDRRCLRDDCGTSMSSVSPVTGCGCFQVDTDFANAFAKHHHLQVWQVTRGIMSCMFLPGSDTS